MTEYKVTDAQHQAIMRKLVDLEQARSALGNAALVFEKRKKEFCEKIEECDKNFRTQYQMILDH